MKLQIVPKWQTRRRPPATQANQIQIITAVATLPPPLYSSLHHPFSPPLDSSPAVYAHVDYNIYKICHKKAAHKAKVEQLREAKRCFIDADFKRVCEGGEGGVVNGVRSGSVRAAAHNKNNLQQIKITPKRIINLNNPLAVDAQQQPHPL